MLQMLKTYVDAHWYREEGASGVEYAILIGIIAIAVAVAAALLVEPIRDTFTDVAGRIPGAG